MIRKWLLVLLLVFGFCHPAHAGLKAVSGGSVTAASIAAAIQTQSGCTTAGYMWVPASNTCVAGGSSLAIGSAVTSGTAHSVLFIDGSGNLAQDNANFYYNPTGYLGGPVWAFGPRGSDPTDDTFAVYNATPGQSIAHFHQVGAQSPTGGARVNLNAAVAGAAILNGSALGSLQFGGSDDTTQDIGVGANVSGVATQNWSTSAMGGQLILNTVPNGSTIPATAALFDQDQSARFYSGIEAGSPTGGNEGAGTVNVSGGYYVNGSPLSASITGSHYQFVTMTGTNTAAGNANIVTDSSGDVSIGTAAAYQINTANALSFPSSDTTAGASIAIGAGALSGQTSSAAYGNTAVGYQALHGTITTGAVSNTAFGYQALNGITSGNNNIGFGVGAGMGLTSGSGNVLIGTNAGQYMGQNSNIAIGLLSQQNNNNCDANTSIGAYSLRNVNCGYVNAYNTAFGYSSGSTITSGLDNLILGGSVASTTLQTGSNNILIGTTSYTDTQSSSSSNTLNIGNLIYGINLGTSNTTPTGSVGIGTATPTGEFALGNASAHAGQATCWTTGGAIGYCTSIVGATGACTCVGL